MKYFPFFAIILVTLAATSSAHAVEEQILGQSVDGRAIVARSYGEDDTEETVLILASIHGSEPAGTPLVEQLEAWLTQHPEEFSERRVVIIPIANPDGYDRRERFNTHEVDLNRNFPADNRTEQSIHGPAALSEPEAVAIMRALQLFTPDRVVSLHQPIACIDYDGPGEALATAMSEAIDGRLPVKKLGGRPGSLGSYVGEVLGKPIITLELPEGAEEKDAETLWKEYGPALIAFVRGIEQ